MTLDEAIKHCDKHAYENIHNGCTECAYEHFQLADWLRELRDCKHALSDMIDDIDSTDWYHIHDGQLKQGANSEVHQALYKADDILKICDKYKKE